MISTITDHSWFKILVFLIAFLTVLVWFFPVESVETGIQNRINQRLPDRIHLVEFSILSHKRFGGSIGFSTRNTIFEFPFRASFPSIFSPREIRIVSPAYSSNKNPSLSMTGNLSERSFKLSADSYPLDVVLPKQEGTVSGTLEANFEGKPSGQFDFLLTVPRLINSSLYPPLARGLNIRKFSGSGQIDGWRARFESLDFRSNQFIFDGKGTLTLRQPLSKTQLSVDLNLKSPVQRKIQQNLTLGSFGISTSDG